MDWALIFNLVNLLALIGWTALILLPRWPALPGRKKVPGFRVSSPPIRIPCPDAIGSWLPSRPGLLKVIGLQGTPIWIAYKDSFMAQILDGDS
jgi:hypothetical protein